jgi:diguanylate cyclase (GGDEF)-like protein
LKQTSWHRAPAGDKKAPMHNVSSETSIRWKLAGAFIAVACFVAAFVGVAITEHFETVELAARMEAEHVAEAIAYAAIDNNTFRPRLQEYVTGLKSLRKRDVVIVDARQKGLADANPYEIGMRYDHDSGDEVGKTISDGRTRTFVESNGGHPDGARQIVVPLRQNASDSGSGIIGAVILEYTAVREELFDAESGDLYLTIAAGIVVALLVVFFGLGIAKRIALPLEVLKSSVERIAAGDYGARVAVTSRNEVGLLGSAFNKMAEDLSVSHAQLVEQKRELEQRVVERTLELNRSNTSLQQEVRQHQLVAERAEYLAYYDVLTGLANRHLFLERVAQYLRGAVSGGHKLAVFLIDLERFKNINDGLGRPAGDALLRQVAEWLTRNAGDANLLARVGADHFAMVMPEITQEGDVVQPIEKAIAAFQEHPFSLNDAVFRIAVKVGVALFPDDGADADTLFRNAEAALEQAKASGHRYLLHARKSALTIWPDGVS